MLSRGWGLGGGVVGKSDFKENPKSDLDLDLGFLNDLKIARVVMFFPKFGSRYLDIFVFAYPTDKQSSRESKHRPSTMFQCNVMKARKIIACNHISDNKGFFLTFF